ncbi:MAG: 2-C-methyl-D-erythritol 4-phosphate cytidylyltransferase [Dermatophilaceae bacterium]
MPKAFVPLGGRPLLRHALDRVLSCPDVDHVVVVAPASHLAQARAEAADAQAVRDEVADAQSGRRDAAPSDPRLVDVVPGGAVRTESVAAGLSALRDDDEFVLVHDAARCFATPALFARVIDALRGGEPAVIPGLPVVDTITQVGADGHVAATLERASLRAVQTPQGFTRAVLTRAHSSGLEATDDATLVEALGERVLVVLGESLAAKVTTAEDLADFERRLS